MTFGVRSAMVSVLPSGIDVRKLQRSHSEISQVEPLSDLPSRLFFRQTLSDINLDRSKVKSDKLLCVNTALEYSYTDPPVWDTMYVYSYQAQWVQ